MNKLLLSFLTLLTACNNNRMHVYESDPPTKHSKYVVYIEVEKNGFMDQGVFHPYDDPHIVKNWDVLEFHPGRNKWNTLHYDPWIVKVLYWSELPADLPFEHTMGEIGK